MKIVRIYNPALSDQNGVIIKLMRGNVLTIGPCDCISGDVDGNELPRRRAAGYQKTVAHVTWSNKLS